MAQSMTALRLSAATAQHKGEQNDRKHRPQQGQQDDDTGETYNRQRALAASLTLSTLVLSSLPNPLFEPVFSPGRPGQRSRLPYELPCFGRWSVTPKCYIRLQVYDSTALPYNRQCKKDRKYREDREYSTQNTERPKDA